MQARERQILLKVLEEGAQGAKTASTLLLNVLDNMAEIRNEVAKTRAEKQEKVKRLMMYEDFIEILVEELSNYHADIKFSAKTLLEDSQFSTIKRKGIEIY